MGYLGGRFRLVGDGPSSRINGVLPADRMAARTPASDNVDPGEWVAYGRNAAGQRYSPLDQITPDNVKQLEKVWEYHAGDIHPDLPGSALESTPLVVNDTLFICTPRSQVIALDPVTGEERWRFDPDLVELSMALARYTTCRGVSYHDDGIADAVTDNPPLTNPAQANALVTTSRARATTPAAGRRGIAQHRRRDRQRR